MDWVKNYTECLKCQKCSTLRHGQRLVILNYFEKELDISLSLQRKQSEWSLCQQVSKIFRPCHKKTCLRAYVVSKGSNQPAHSGSLIRIFTVRVRCLIDTKLCREKAFIQLSKCKADQSSLGANPKYLFCQGKAHLHFSSDTKNKLNPCPAEPGYAMPFKTVQIQIRWLLQDLHCLSFSW